MPKLRDYIRPVTVAALLLLLLLGAVIAGALEVFVPGKGVQFTVGVAAWLRAVPDAYYQLLGALGLGYMAARSVDKKTETPDAPPPEKE